MGLDGGPTGCSSDSDCTNHPNGYCSQFDPAGGLPPGCSCYYGCQTDADCGTGQVCLCGNPVGQCVPASCTSDADCGTGLLCTMSAPLGTCPSAPPFACRTPSDACAGPKDCATAGGAAGTCGYNNGVHECVPECAFGRPFLVLGAARTAATERRADWQARDLEPSVEGLTAAQREVLAGAWADAAAMEHASIAAFARFALQLLSVGAPASLVERTHEAMRDETEHAQLCFTLASRYAGRPLGPSALRVQDALAELEPESILTTTILEGCIGEMVAAIEAAEALQHTRDPAVGAVLARIAEDEARHAELAWRYLRWATAQSERLRALAERTFALAIAGAKPAPAAGADDQTETLLAYGVVSERLRTAIRARVLREVVGPCAEALLAAGAPVSVAGCAASV